MVYVIVVAPAATPVTIPVAAPTVPLATVLLVQVPPDAVSVNAIVAPTHTPAAPEITDGIEFTVTVFAIAQPVGSVYVTGTVPAVTPVTMPDVPIVATVISLLTQVPPPASANVVVTPTQVIPVPVIAAGSAFTETTLVAVQPEEMV
jgi:hypothetical protein